jgi:pyridoxine/pyridoxamine 5'-phosphate oxidase
MTPASVLPFLRRHRLAVVSTVRDGAPQAAVVGIAVTDALDIFFDTLSASRKYANLVADPRVALVIGWDGEETVQIEGIADVPSGDELAACKQAYFEVCRTGASARNGRRSPMSGCGRAGCATAISAGRRRALKS